MPSRWSRSYICLHCVVWLCAWRIIDSHPLYRAAQVVHLGPTAKRPCCSSCSCVHCGSFRIRICATGYAIGLPSHLRAACHLAKMALPESLALHNTVSPLLEQGLPCHNRFSSFL